MATYHADLQTFTRTLGDTIAQRLAYRIGGVIQCSRTGVVHDYRRKRGIAFVATVAPDGADGLRRLERAEAVALWASAETAERRRNSQLAREFVLALPAELDAKAHTALSIEFASALALRHGVAVTAATHEPTADNDERNFHAHVLWTTRTVVAAEGANAVMGKKTREFDEKDRSGPLVAKLRKDWERMVNAALEAAGVTARVDCRSLAARGIARPPRLHLGPAASAMERRGIRTRAGDYNREVDRLEAEEEAAKAEAEKARRRAASRSGPKPRPRSSVSERKEPSKRARNASAEERLTPTILFDEPGYEMMTDAEINTWLFSWTEPDSPDPGVEEPAAASGQVTDDRPPSTATPEQPALQSSVPAEEASDHIISDSGRHEVAVATGETHSSSRSEVFQSSPIDDDFAYQPMSDAEIDALIASDSGCRLLDELTDEGPESPMGLPKSEPLAEASTRHSVQERSENPPRPLMSAEANIRNGPGSKQAAALEGTGDSLTETLPSGYVDDGYEPMSDAEFDTFLQGVGGQEILDRIVEDEGGPPAVPGVAGRVVVAASRGNAQHGPDHPRNQQLDAAKRSENDERTVIQVAPAASAPLPDDGYQPMSDDEVVLSLQAAGPPLPTDRDTPRHEDASDGLERPFEGAKKEEIFEPEVITGLYKAAVASSRIIAFCLRAIAISSPDVSLEAEIRAAIIVADFSKDEAGKSLFRQIAFATKAGRSVELPKFAFDARMRAVRFAKLIAELAEYGSTLLVKFIQDESGFGVGASAGRSQRSGRGGRGDD